MNLIGADSLLVGNSVGDTEGADGLIELGTAVGLVVGSAVGAADGVPTRV